MCWLQKGSKTNILPLMGKLSLQLELTLLHELRYPEWLSFCFEGFSGVDDHHQLVSPIIDCAKKIDGTQLPGCYNKTPSQKRNAVIIILIIYIDYILI